MRIVKRNLVVPVLSAFIAIGAIAASVLADESNPIGKTWTCPAPCTGTIFCADIGEMGNCNRSGTTWVCECGTPNQP